MKRMPIYRSGKEGVLQEKQKKGADRFCRVMTELRAIAQHLVIVQFQRQEVMEGELDQSCEKGGGRRSRKA